MWNYHNGDREDYSCLSRTLCMYWISQLNRYIHVDVYNLKPLVVTIRSMFISLKFNLSSHCCVI